MKTTRTADSRTTPVVPTAENLAAKQDQDLRAPKAAEQDRTAVPQIQGVLAHLHKIQTRRSESGFPELRSHRRDDLWFSAGSTSFINCLSQK